MTRINDLLNFNSKRGDDELKSEQFFININHCILTFYLLKVGIRRCSVGNYYTR